MSISVKGRHYIVTGGLSGLGQAVVEELTKHGAVVTIFDRAGETKISGCEAVVVDVTDSAGVAAAVKAAVARKERLDGVVNCAGIASAAVTVKRNKTAHDLSVFEKVIRVNLTGTFNVASQCAASMAKLERDEARCIINVASIAAFEGQAGQAAYAASKAGVVGMTLVLARDLAKYGIRVNTIAPGIFMTAMVKGMPPTVQKNLLKDTVCPERFGDPKEFATMVRCMIENPYLNAETIRLDAGTRMAKM